MSHPNRSDKDRLGWSISEAKAQLSRLLDRIAQEPQIVTDRGKPAAVVVSVEQFHRLEISAARSEPRARWQGFLTSSATMRTAGGAGLRLARRTARPSPFER